jgi:NDP-sugar pyrophosphorylase family protein
MKAMIFSAGLGTRLYPLTEHKPKALAPFLNTTLLEYNINFLKAQGINSFIINTHHFAEEIEKYVISKNNFDCEIIVSYEEILLDTAGGLISIYPYIKNERKVLIYNVDIISNIDIKKFTDFHNSADSDISLAVRNRPTSRFLIFNDKGKMCGWENIKTGEQNLKRNCSKSVEKYAYSGIGLINTEIIPMIGKVEKKSLIPFFLDICSEKKISAFYHQEDYWYDCGTLQNLEEAQNQLNEKII